jgi:wobble nucleotide-excising tRNase
MPAIIANISKLENAGIYADRGTKSESFNFCKYNLIYGFNGSGKSTLSRIFSSLELGAVHPKLPKDCAFEVTMNDGVTLSAPDKASGLERRVMVFNSDFAEKNFQWAMGTANPVFFIGKEQADAYKELEETEKSVAQLVKDVASAEAAERQASNTLATFKRERAKLTAARLNLGSRKYEAPQLTRDYLEWQAIDTPAVSSETLSAAEELRRASQPMAEVPEIKFDQMTIPNAFRFIRDTCAQSLGTVALDEVQKIPEALLWIKQGHELHIQHELSACLHCGNDITPERRAILKSALDNTIDQFIGKLNRTSDRLNEVIAYLSTLRENAPRADAFYSSESAAVRSERISLAKYLTEAMDVLGLLRDILRRKLAAPATPIDISGLPSAEDVDRINGDLSASIISLNALINLHNKTVRGFQLAQTEAEILIRKHFIRECRAEFDQHTGNHAKAKKKREDSESELTAARDKAAQSRQAVRTHGPAADAINRIVKSYLGHGELTIHAIETGYEIRRHGSVIDGLPSEGEKTAISIAYFLSTIESDGKSLKDAIVVVDDPVSSLDTKALNYACSLVKTRLQGAAQLFIITHNSQCMNEFRKYWKSGLEGKSADGPTSAFFFIDVSIPIGQERRVSKIVRMPKFLREYDSEYHFLFSELLLFHSAGEEYFERGYMMPNVMRRILDIFLAFKCPGSSGLSGKLQQLCAAYPDLDRDRLIALERLTQVESHSDNLDDLISFSSMTIEESRDAAKALLVMMEEVDGAHLKALKKLCT